MGLLNKVHLEINDETEVIVDFNLVSTVKGFDFEVSKLLFSDANSEFFLSEKPYDTQKLYLEQASDAVDKYISKNYNEMLVEAADDNMLALMAVKEA